MVEPGEEGIAGRPIAAFSNTLQGIATGCLSRNQMMQIKVQLIVEDDAGNGETVEISQFQRDSLSCINLGLTLAESKEIL